MGCAWSPLQGPEAQLRGFAHAATARVRELVQGRFGRVSVLHTQTVWVYLHLSGPAVRLVMLSTHCMSAEHQELHEQLTSLRWISYWQPLVQQDMQNVGAFSGSCNTESASQILFCHCTELGDVCGW